MSKARKIKARKIKRLQSSYEFAIRKILSAMGENHAAKRRAFLEIVGL